MRKQSRFIDSSKFDGVGSVIGGRGESVSHRTDFIDLIYKAQTTERGQNVVDSDFRSGIEFELGHNSQLNLQTQVLNKNKAIFFMIYPRLYYTLPFRLRLLSNEMKRNEDEESVDHVGSTQLEAACSFGA